ncbi:MAG: hypothetical protein IJ167_00555 [Lachnospiraceae bacterium]|nr:hypothetical protein [Lachnospiraceae bacterium]
MTKIKSINSNQLYIAQNAEVSLKLAGNTAQVTFTAGKNRKCPIKNLSKDEFVDLSTGEVKKRRHSENRFQSPKSVRKSINSLMDLIRCNASNPANCKWITLTYQEEMTDCKRVFKDNKAFLRKLRNYLKKQKLPESKSDFKFIAVAEPQGENHGNAWHMHLLLIFYSKAPFISNQEIADLWGYGMTDTHKVYDADTLALYFRAYLSDVEYVDDNSDDSAEISIDILSDYEREQLEKTKAGVSNANIVTKNVGGVNKKFIKGERLKYYPTGMPLYSCSRGMKRPTVERVANKDIKNKLKNYYMLFRQSLVIGDKDKGNIVDKRYYQKKGTGSGRYWRKTNKAVVPDKPVKPIDPLWKIKEICKRGLNGTVPDDSNIRPMDADVPEILRGFGAKKVIG